MGLGLWLVAHQVALADSPSPCSGPQWSQPVSGTEIVAVDDIRLMFRSVPPKPTIGEHFSLDVTVCKAAQPFEGTLRVDAQMPGHGHGMNYQPQVESVKRGQFQAQGLMLHMPGHWQYEFTLDDKGVSKKLVKPYHAH